MDVFALRLFVAVARRRSFAAVAQDEGIDPSSVSRTIGSLEGELGVRLFQRTTRTMALTEAGERYLNRVEPLIDEFDRARDEAVAARSDPVGTLRVTATVTFGQMRLLPLLGRFRAAFPRIQLEMLLTDAILDLVEDRIDIAIRLAPSYGAHVIGVKLFPMRYHVVASPDYLSREGKPHAPRDLAVHSCLLFPIPEFRSRWIFRQGQTIEEVPVRGELVLSTALALRRAALNGLGPVLLADWLIGDDVANGRLIDIFPEYDVTATTFDTAAWLLYPSRDYLPHKVRMAIDFFRQHLSAAV